MYDEIISIIGTPPVGMEWLVYLCCVCLFIFIFSNGLRIIGYILGGGRR